MFWGSSLQKLVGLGLGDKDLSLPWPTSDLLCHSRQRTSPLLGMIAILTPGVLVLDEEIIDMGGV